jgi:hypothetical protein
MSLKYYYLIMSQKEMIQNQVLEEILRERANYYFSKQKSLDFWVTLSPLFLDNLNLHQKILKTNFYKQQKSSISSTSSTSDLNFYASLISLDKDFINWIQLRLGYFEDISNQSNEKNRTNYISDGIYGSFQLNELDQVSPLESNDNFINPEIILNKYKKILDISYSYKDKIKSN